jgi:hypothetical protein
MTLHLSQIFFTLGLTFTIRLPFLLIPINDATSGEVIWTKFYNHTIFRQDTNVVLSHLSADMCKHFMSIGELNALGSASATVPSISIAPSFLAKR